MNYVDSKGNQYTEEPKLLARKFNCKSVTKFLMRALLTIALIYFAWRVVNTTWYSSTDVSENITAVSNHINYNINIVKYHLKPRPHNQVESKQSTEVSDESEPSTVEVTSSVKNTNFCGFHLAPFEHDIIKEYGFYSPQSLRRLFEMVLLGVSGDTKKQIRSFEFAEDC